MNTQEMADLSPEGYPALTRKLRRIGAAEPVRLPSGSMAWPMGAIENLSLTVVESRPGVEFEEKGHPEEAVILVLEGLVMYDNGRCVREDEAVLQCPDTPYKGRYAGTETVRLLCFKALPQPGTKPPAPLLMGIVSRLKDIPPVKFPFGTGALRRDLFRTDNLKVSVVENRPVMDFADPGHWDPEIVYTLEGKLEYFDGRTVRPGDAVTNGYNVPHPGRYAGVRLVRIVEASTSLYRVPGGFQPDGEMLPGYVNGWDSQPLSQRLAVRRTEVRRRFRSR